MKQRLAILGSTGSIGTQTLDIVRENLDKLEITTLTACRNWQTLAAQAREFLPDSVVIADEGHYGVLKSALADTDVKVYAGSDAVCQVASGSEVDTVVNAIVGYAGLESTLCSLEAGKKVALANKESLVVAGELVIRTEMENNAMLIPVDSEHSAIFQCIAGEVSPVRRIILTASGGPFRNTPREEMAHVTPEMALRHPNWEMGAKITIDSATLVNKGFEMIEARWLFGIPAAHIDVLVHPTSTVHSMVEFTDGSIKAQLGTPDMRGPISYALSYPERWPTYRPGLDFGDRLCLEFCRPDRERFPALDLAYWTLDAGGDACCVMNAVNEVAVENFLSGRIPFTAIAELISRVLDVLPTRKCATIDDFRASDRRARHEAVAAIEKFY